MEKKKQLYVLLALVKSGFTTTSFDLQMSKGAHDIFAQMTKFLKVD